MSFFNELKRRNVFKVAAAYLIVGWLVMQVTDTFAPALRLPEWFPSAVAFLLLLGLPVAVFFAWAFELTPDGIRRESEVESGQSVKIHDTRKLDRMIIVALLAVVVVLMLDRFLPGQANPEAITTADTSVETPSQEPTTQTVDPGNEQSAPTPSTEDDSLESNSIAVLPFVNMSDDAGNEYFSDGLSEELLNLLVKIPELQVAARTSSFSFKGKDIKIPQIAQELSVIYVLEGSVRKAGNHVRITAQLIKADDGFHLWSETYDRDLDDIFVVQDEIASKVVAALRITLMGEIPESRQTDPEVYSLVLQGRYFDNLKGQEDLENAISAYEQALAIDPDYVPAWIGLSVAYQNQRKYGWRTEEQAFALSMEATEKALAIDRSTAAAWASLAYLKKHQLDWAGAKAAIDKASALEPNNSFVLGTSASLAGNLGQLETSIELFERIVKLNPLSLSSLRALGIRYSDAGRFDEAIETFNRVIAINPDFPGIHINLAATYLHKGDPETALIEVEKNSSARIYEFLKVSILSALGNEAEAQAIINQLLETSALENPIAMAATYAWRGENDLSFEWLEIAFQQDKGSLAYFLRRPWNKRLETDPRYPAFVEKLGLLEAWKSIPRPDEESRQ